MDLVALKSELTTDPLARGYSGLGDEAAANNLNTVNRTRERPTVTGAQIYNALDPAEFTALSAANQTKVRDIFGLGGDIDVRTGRNARVVLLSLFGAATATRAALAALVQEPCSRAVELGLGTVTPSDVADARRLP